MSRSHFATLLKKYLSGGATPSERRIVEEWYGLLEEEPRPLEQEQWEELEGRLWHKMVSSGAGAPEEKDAYERPIWRRYAVHMGVAAAVALLLLFGFFRAGTGDNGDIPAPAPQSAALKSIRNLQDSDTLLTLEDGSRVRLSPGAQLSFPGYFEAEKREVFLAGDAFFEVSENPDRPFFVYAGSIVTKVLGTSFLVRAPEKSGDVEVAVKTGRVVVYDHTKPDLSVPAKGGNGVVLNPNHQVTFVNKNKLFVTSLVEEPAPLQKDEQVSLPAFRYVDTPLAAILKELSDTYRIEIELERKSLGECPLTADLSGKGLYAQIGLICAAIQGSYEIKGTTILVNGKECE